VEEIVLIVDSEDNVVDQVPRSVMRAQALRHRVTYIFVFDSTGKLFVQKRTTTKDLYPGYFDLAAGGVVCVGESYEESALREAGEELGIRDQPLKSHFKFYFEEAGNQCWGQVYSCIHNGPFELQKEEVASGEFVDVDRILRGDIAPITPDTLAVLKRYLEEQG
jgi:isopentenyldiphosphate isomerase